MHSRRKQVGKFESVICFYVSAGMITSRRWRTRPGKKKLTVEDEKKPE